MIPFDIEKMYVEHVRLKNVTTALGGSISILDAERSTDKKEVFKRIPVPFAVARSFIKEHEVSKYFKPVLTAVTFYDGRIVALERHPLGGLGEEITEGLFGVKHWFSESEKNLDNMILPLTSHGEWFIDGTLLYTVPSSSIANAEWLTSDGKFRSINAEAIKLAEMGSKEIDTIDRVCLQYISSNGAMGITSPLWKKLGKIGSKQLDRVDTDDSDDGAVINEDEFQFDRVDEHLAVNLSFALKAGTEIAEIFGYDSIEPLQLDKLMVQLKTVNLPKVPKAVKQTFDIGLSFTHTVAWLIGLTQRVETLESYMVLRSLLKHLTSKGVYRKNAFDPNTVYRQGMTAENVPLKTVDEAVTTSSERYAGIGILKDHNDVGLVGSLYGAE